MKIRYLKAHFGIQPGTVVDEHRPDVVERLTAWNVIDEKKGLRDRIAEPVEDDATPTTEQAEQDFAAKKASAKPEPTKKGDAKKSDDKKPDDKK